MDCDFDVCVLAWGRGWSLPYEVVNRIVGYLCRRHTYQCIIPDGPRDNGENVYVCRNCGHVWPR